MIGVTVFAAMAILLIGYALMLYGGLMRAEHRVRSAWSTLRDALARREVEFVQLLELYAACPESTRGERQPIEAARRAVRAACDAHDAVALGAAESALRAAVPSLYASITRDLGTRAEALLRALEFRIRALETAIWAHHETYNAAARAQNARLQMFPDALIGAACHFAPAPLIDFGTCRDGTVNLDLALAKSA